MIELRRVLCPVDFSDGSARAVGHARALAAWYEAELRLLHVYHVAAVAPFAPEVGPAVVLSDESRAEIRRELQRFAERGESFPIAPRADVIDGAPAACILEAAREWPADLIVLGTHGRSGLPRLVLGSVAERVLRQAACPVLTVPPHSAESNGRATFTRILCATDFSPSASRALEFAASLAQEADAALIVAHVFELEGALPERWRNALTPAAVRQELLTLETERRERLERAVSADVQTYCTVEKVMCGGTPYKEILRVAAARQCDLIVLGVHGRHAADLLFFGSTTNHVIRQAACPVLTVRS